MKAKFTDHMGDRIGISLESETEDEMLLMKALMRQLQNPEAEYKRFFVTSYGGPSNKRNMHLGQLLKSETEVKVDEGI